MSARASVYLFAASVAVAGCAGKSQPPQPPPPTQATDNAVMLAPNRGTSLRVSDLNQPPHRPLLPPRLNRSGNVLWGMYKVCVGTDGMVSRVATILPPPDNDVNAQWIGAMNTWRYNPHVVDGVAVPFCHPVRIEVRAD